MEKSWRVCKRSIFERERREIRIAPDPIYCTLIYHTFIFFFFRANQQRSQKIFKAQQPMDLTQVRTKLQGFGMQLLDGIDPNPDNFVCAGIVHMRAQQVGCLLRLEPNKQAQVIRKSFQTYEKFNIVTSDDFYLTLTFLLYRCFV